uniref:Uncharacterized protein n=1 Tax=viral metagenome TaxID=1070528 RepID=A0A6M3K078_9ZZZZ
MTETRLRFKLVRPAKSNGGDRYEHSTKGDGEWMVIYIPQTISRKGGSPAKELNITISISV